MGQTLPDGMMMAGGLLQLKHKPIQSTAKMFGINYKTLARYCSKTDEQEIAGRDVCPYVPVGYVKNRMVLSEEQED